MPTAELLSVRTLDKHLHCTLSRTHTLQSSVTKNGPTTSQAIGLGYSGQSSCLNKNSMLVKATTTTNKTKPISLKN